jgi:hypothetical protein
MRLVDLNSRAAASQWGLAVHKGPLLGLRGIRKDAPAPRCRDAFLGELGVGGFENALPEPLLAVSHWDAETNQFRRVLFKYQPLGVDEGPLTAAAVHEETRSTLVQSRTVQPLRDWSVPRRTFACGVKCVVMQRHLDFLPDGTLTSNHAGKAVNKSASAASGAAHFTMLVGMNGCIFSVLASEKWFTHLQ